MDSPHGETSGADAEGVAALAIIIRGVISAAETITLWITCALLGIKRAKKTWEHAKKRKRKRFFIDPVSDSLSRLPFAFPKKTDA